MRRSKHTGTERFLILILFSLLFSLHGCTLFSPRPKNMARTVFNVTPQAESISGSEFERSMDRLTATHLTSGNQATLLTNGDTVFPAMLHAIRSAKTRISLGTYIFRMDSVGERFFQALLDAVKRGVTVRFLCDTVGSRTVNEETFKKLTEAGAEVRFFNPLANWTAIRLNNRNHQKILVVDGHTAFMGGLNLATEYDGNGATGWRDTAVQITGPAALEAERIFADSWVQGGDSFLGKDLPVVGLNPIKRAIDEPFLRLLGRQNDFIPSDTESPVSPATGTALVRAVSSSPDQMSSTILDMYLLAINSAKRHVYVSCGYFIPPKTLSRALIQASRRGVDVRLITQGETDEPTVRKISIGFYGRFLKEGIRIYEWQKTILHAKIMVVDDRWSTIGSANLDGRALFLNYEANFSITSPEFGSRMSDQFHQDLVKCVEIDLPTWQKRSVKQKTSEVLLRPFEDQF